MSKLNWKETLTPGGAKFYSIEDRKGYPFATIHKNVFNDYSINIIERGHRRFEGTLEQAKQVAEKELKRIAEEIIKMYL